MYRESPDLVWQQDRFTRNLDENVEHMYQLKEHIAKGLSEIEDIRINGMPLRERCTADLEYQCYGSTKRGIAALSRGQGIYTFRQEVHAPAIRESQALH